MIETQCQHLTSKKNLSRGEIIFRTDGPTELLISHVATTIRINGIEHIDSFFSIMFELSEAWGLTLAGWQADDAVDAAKEPDGSEGYDPTDQPF